MACLTLRKCYVSCHQWCCFVILLCSFLHVANSGEMPEMDVVCVKDKKKMEFHLTTIKDKKELAQKCILSDQIYLKNQTQIFTSEGLAKQELSIILSISFIRMCLEISHTDAVDLSLSGSIEGKCQGPALRITNNNNLTVISIGARLTVNQFEKRITVSIRGNPKIMPAYFDEFRRKFGAEHVDLQPPGECSLPKPFKDFADIKGCTSVYGPLVLDGPKSPTTFSPEGISEFNYTGCIQIKNTNIDDYKFLEQFKKFTLIEGCNQYIIGNKNLCINNFDFFLTVFPGIKIYDNKYACEAECIGGVVTEEYLQHIPRCRTVHGDLKIQDWWYNKPKSVKNLKNIDIITGRLFITNNTGISEIDDFSSLKYVGKKDTNDVVIIVQDNPTLSSLNMPKLVGITISKTDPRLQLRNNPKLKLSGEIAPLPSDDKHTTKYPGDGVPDNATDDGGFLVPRQEQPPPIMPSSSKTKKGFWSGFWSSALKRWYIIVAVIVVLTIILLLLLIILLLVQRKKHRAFSMSISPYKLDSNSSFALKGLCRDVLALDPFVWCAKERDLLWASGGPSTTSDFERQAAGADEPLLEDKDEDLLKRRMIPIASNARIPLKKETDYNKPLLFRSQQLFPFELPVIITNVDDISDSMPRLPKKIGKMELYSDAKINTSVTYKLTRIRHPTENLKLYVYEVRNVRMHLKRIMKALFYFRSSDQRFQRDLAEPLEIFGFVHKRNAILLSTRYKELYSLLHLIFIVIIQLKKPVPLKELFRIHTQNCNGAPLDRFEMLYALRFILEWANSTACIPPDIENDPEQWGQIYDEIAKFSELHPNIANIHPRHVFGRIPELEERMKNAENTPGRQFSERPPAPMFDRFRPMTPEEIKKKHNQIVSSGEAADEDSEQVSAAKDDFWKQKPARKGEQFPML